MADKYLTIKFEGDEQALHRWLMSAMPDMAAALEGRLDVKGFSISGRDPGLPADAHHEELRRASEAAVAGHEKCEAGATLDEHIESLLQEIDHLRKSVAVAGAFKRGLVEAHEAVENHPPHVAHAKVKDAITKARAVAGAFADMDARRWRRNHPEPPVAPVILGMRGPDR